VGVKASRLRYPDERIVSKLSTRKAGFARYFASILKEPRGWEIGGKLWVFVVNGGNLDEMGTPMRGLIMKLNNLIGEVLTEVMNPIRRDSQINLNG
jgi:hypothetical protein